MSVKNYLQYCMNFGINIVFFSCLNNNFVERSIECYVRQYTNSLLLDMQIRYTEV